MSFDSAFNIFCRLMLIILTFLVIVQSIKIQNMVNTSSKNLSTELVQVCANPNFTTDVQLKCLDIINREAK